MDLGGLPDFDLAAPGPLSDLARARGLRTFRAAAGYVRDLPYRRPSAGTEPSAVLTEECGTCSSKHAVLAGLAHEQGGHEIELMLGIYEMTGRNPACLLMEKVSRHRAFIEQWSAQCNVDPNHVWSAREGCIRAFQQHEAPKTL